MIGTNPRFRTKLLFLIGSCLFVLLLALYLPRIRHPFWGHHEFNGVFYGTIARNYHRYGLLQTKGAQITTPYLSENSSWNFHTHHPATYPLILYFATLILSFTESSLRLISLIATALASYLWLYQHKESQAKLIASFFALVLVLSTPLLRYYGFLPVFEPLLLPLTLLGLLLYRKHQIRTLALVCFLASLLDWPGYWLGIWIAVFSLLDKDYKTAKIIGLVLLLSTMLIVGHQWIAYGNPFGAIVQIGSERLSLTNQPYTTYEWLRLLISRTKAFWGTPLLLTTFMGVAVGLKQKNKTLLLAFMIGVSHIFVFRNITWYHDYMLYHLIPFFLYSVTQVFYITYKRATGISLIVFTGLIGLNVLMTNKFAVDLMAITPHKECVEFGKKISSEGSTKIPVFFGSSEEIKTCPPFIGFYGMKPFTSQEILTN